MSPHLPFLAPHLPFLVPPLPSLPPHLPCLPISPSCLPISPSCLPISPSCLPISPSCLPVSPSRLPISPSLSTSRTDTDSQVHRPSHWDPAILANRDCRVSRGSPVRAGGNGSLGLAAGSCFTCLDLGDVSRRQPLSMGLADGLGARLSYAARRFPSQSVAATVARASVGDSSRSSSRARRTAAPATVAAARPAIAAVVASERTAAPSVAASAASSVAACTALQAAAAAATAGKPQSRAPKAPTARKAAIGEVLGGIFGATSPAEKTRQQYAEQLAQVNRLEAIASRLSDGQLRGTTRDLQQRVAAGETLESVLPEAFAVVREASKRVLGLRPFDVQLIGTPKHTLL
ncbi:unnamed protein product [Closterium sp. NIES-54]